MTVSKRLLTARWSRWLGCGALALTASAAAALEPADLEASRVGALKKLEITAAAPPVEDVAFLGPDGAALTLADFSGRVVVLNYWATWCPPCLKELPSLDRLAAALAAEGLADRVAVLAVSVDMGDGAKPAAWLAKNGVENLPLHHDPTFAGPKRIRARGLPTTLIVGPQGRELARFEGDTEWDAAEVVAMLRRAAELAAAAE